ncbi:MAG: hypothetical protein JW789_01280 [Candidatus Aenigmarchaeota archaeon]|nr:hypothetical protein [Candidatus Aenigmarchaeota archaeon]
MKIPKREVVKFVLKSALHRKKASSQDELVGIINTELRKVDSDYSITGKRIRLIAASMPDIRMDVVTRKGRVPPKCPSCGYSLKKSWDRNLRGRKVLRSLKCGRCGYKGTSGRWSPGKYIFCVSKT